jgi:3alpha(or 20beta)-hydroxysteroid dehydrogenase
MNRPRSTAVPLVTGASCGRGAEHARRLSSDGPRMLATDVVDAAANHFGGQFRELDVTDGQQRTDVVADVVAEYGRLDVPVNDAGIAGASRPVEETSGEASTWAIRGMTRTAAIELAGTGVWVNATVPGWVDTRMATEAVLPVAEIAAGIPMKRIAAPSEISAVVSFLASTESRYMSGSDLVVDGDVHARV